MFPCEMQMLLQNGRHKTFKHFFKHWHRMQSTLQVQENM